jgi:hypothetical protein
MSTALVRNPSIVDMMQRMHDIFVSAKMVVTDSHGRLVRVPRTMILADGNVAVVEVVGGELFVAWNHNRDYYMLGFRVQQPRVSMTLSSSSGILFEFIVDDESEAATMWGSGVYADGKIGVVPIFAGVVLTQFYDMRPMPL